VFLKLITRIFEWVKRPKKASAKNFLISQTVERPPDPKVSLRDADKYFDS